MKPSNAIKHRIKHIIGFKTFVTDKLTLFPQNSQTLESNGIILPQY